MNKLEELEAQLKDIQQQIDEMKIVHTGMPYKNEPCYFPMLAGCGEWYFESCNFNIDRLNKPTTAESDQNIFPTEEIASAYGDAFRVMLELRRCVGAGHYYEEYGEKCGYTYDGVCIAHEWGGSQLFSLVPPFPTRELCQAAVDKIGCLRIQAAYKLLANVK